MAAVLRTEITVPDYNDSFCYFKTGGKLFQLRFSWNDTEQRWSFGVYNSLREPIAIGIKLVPNCPLNIFTGREELMDGIFGVETELEAVGRNDFLEGNAHFVYLCAA